MPCAKIFTKHNTNRRVQEDLLKRTVLSFSHKRSSWDLLTLKKIYAVLVSSSTDILLTLGSFYQITQQLISCSKSTSKTVDSLSISGEMFGLTLT